VDLVVQPRSTLVVAPQFYLTQLLIDLPTTLTSELSASLPDQ
jgi:hypothetical protein